MSRARRLSSQMCPRFQAAVDILGRRWTGMVLHALAGGPLRFGELRDRLEVVSDRMLSARLKELETEELVARRVVPQQPVRVEYELTNKGAALRGVLDGIGRWAESWVEPPPRRAARTRARTPRSPRSRRR